MDNEIAIKIKGKNRYSIQGENGIYRKLKGEYKGYEVYAEVDDSFQGDIGLPQFILINEKEKEKRYNHQGNEWADLMNKL